MHPGEVLGMAIVASIALSLIVMIGLTLRHTRKAKHLERMAMIEKGLNPYEAENEGVNKMHIPVWMKLSSVMAGLGLGFMVSGFTASWFPAMEGPMTVGPMLLLGGLGLGFPYFLHAYFQTHGSQRS